jgi:hypothetical protein
VEHEIPFLSAAIYQYDAGRRKNLHPRVQDPSKVRTMHENPRRSSAAGRPVKRAAFQVDTGVMAVRTIGLLCVVAALAAVGWLYSRQASETGPRSELAQKAQADASAGVAGASFGAAAPELQAWFSEHGTYAGVTLSPSYNVVVRRADATSYCLQAGSGAAVQHLTGPGDTVEPGPCA